MALSPRRATGTQRSSHTTFSGAGVPVRGGRVTKNRLKGRGKAQPKSEMLLKLQLQSNPEALCLVRATIERASGEKCERCWKYSTAVGQDAGFPTVCDSCSVALKEMLG